MKRAGVVLQGALWAFLLWLYLGDLVVLARLDAAPVAALGALPSLPVALLGAALALAGAGLFVFARLKPVPPRWRWPRLAVALALMLLAADLGMVSMRQSGLGADAQLVLAVQGLAGDLGDIAVPEGVPRDPALLEDALTRLAPPPLYAEGVRLERWHVQVRERCEGPASDVAGVAAGTFVYCVAGDRKRAWVSLVALPRGEHFGAPALFGREPPEIGEVVAPPAPTPEELVAPVPPEDLVEPPPETPTMEPPPPGAE